MIVKFDFICQLFKQKTFQASQCCDIIIHVDDDESCQSIAIASFFIVFNRRQKKILFQLWEVIQMITHFILVENEFLAIDSFFFLFVSIATVETQAHDSIHFIGEIH